MPTRRNLGFLLTIFALSITGVALYLTQLTPSTPDPADPKTAADYRHTYLPLSGDGSTNQNPPMDPKYIWFSDYKNSNVKAVDHSGQIVWEQHFSFASANEEELSNIEFVTVTPHGNPMVTTANGMLIQEVDRATKKVIWKYGFLNHQYCDQCLHQPKKAYLFNDNEVLVTDANSRRAIIIDKNTNQVIWEYGVKNIMKDAPGYLKGNRFAMPLDNQGANILITDTLTKRIMVVDRATKNIAWQWEAPDSQWLQNAYPGSDGSFIAEDHLKNKVFKVSRDHQIVWEISTLADGTALKYPTDAISLPNGNVLIAEAGHGRIIEVNPQTRQIIWEYSHAGFVTSIDVEYEKPNSN